ncbi:unnamed protein product [Pedinophyceae sp. YPF-701]|nr:unnamed protein product [Pedinophyceae sp. YPF-701]
MAPRPRSSAGDSPRQSAQSALNVEHDAHRDSSERGALLPRDRRAAPVPVGVAPNDDEVEAVVRKLNRRILPIHFALALICYLDRANLAFAALQMNHDLGLSKADYGLGSGLFFVGYAAFQLPSNIALSRVGAPAWLATIMCVWGVLATAMAGIRGIGSFLALRLLLGAAEAGTFPGIWFHLSCCFPPEHVGEAYTKVATVTAVSAIVGGPVAAALMQLDGAWGLRGWQWLFLLEGLPCIVMAGVVFLGLPHSLGRTGFLSDGERRLLEGLIAARAARNSGREDEGAKREGLRAQLARVGANAAVWHLGTVWGLAECTLYGVIFWMPLIIGDALGRDAAADGGGGNAPTHHGVAGTGMVAVLSSIPFAAASISMLYVARRSVVKDERHRHTSYPLWAAAACLIIFVPLGGVLGWGLLSFVALTIAAGGVWAIHGPFMSWPGMVLHGSDKALGIAVINSVGAIGGFVGPYLIGVLAHGRGDYSLAFAVLGVLLIASGALAWAFKEPPLLLDEGASGAGGSPAESPHRLHPQMSAGGIDP